MLAIKLKPIGKKKQISYRIVVSPKRSKLNGKFIEDLGWYNPHTNKFLVNSERAKHWIDNGAQPTDTIYNILVNAKVVDGPKKKIRIRSKKKEAVGDGVNEAQMKKEEISTDVESDSSVGDVSENDVSGKDGDDSATDNVKENIDVVDKVGGEELPVNDKIDKIDIKDTETESKEDVVGDNSVEDKKNKEDEEDKKDEEDEKKDKDGDDKKEVKEKV